MAFRVTARAAAFAVSTSLQSHRPDCSADVAVNILTPYAFAELSSVVFLSAELLPVLHTSLPAFASAPASNLQPRTTAYNLGHDGGC